MIIIATGVEPNQIPVIRIMGRIVRCQEAPTSSLSLKDSISGEKGKGLNTKPAVISKQARTNGKKERSVQLRCALQEVRDPESRLLANKGHGQLWAKVSCERPEIQMQTLCFVASG